jgi:hemerythrin-like domain-containing protein
MDDVRMMCVVTATLPTDPADTRMMGIVHSALRRGLVRTRIVLEASPLPAGERRTALADHVLWLMDFLHHHHTNEDTGLFPMVLAANPAAGELLATMDADHHRIAPRITSLEEAAREYRSGSAGSDAALLAAVNGLLADMCPHLEREEREMMPVVSSSITYGDWRAWEHDFNKTRNMRQLADEGHWVIDNLDAVRRDIVVHVVPAVPRFILVNFLGGPYKKKAALLWGGTPAATVPSLSVDEYPRYA